MATLISPEGGFAEYIHSDFRNYASNRQNLLEASWNDNRDAFRGLATKKWKLKEGEGWRSDTVINAIKQKVISGFSLVIDMLLSGGRFPFTLKPSPWDDVQFEDLSEEEQDIIRDNIDDMQGLIDQQLLESSADRVLMKVVLSEAIYGEGIAKRMTNDVLRSGYRQMNEFATSQEDFFYEEMREYVVSPGVTYVSVWDFFRDLEDPNLRTCAGMYHRQMVSPYWLQQKTGQAYFIDENIKRVLEMDPQSAASGTSGTVATASTGEQGIETTSLTPAMREITHRINTILYLERWGRVPIKQLREFQEQMQIEGLMLEGAPRLPGVDAIDDDETGKDVECMVCTANGLVVRYALTDPKDRPFYRSLWEDSLDEVGGTGIADNGMNAQNMLTGAVRAFEDNKKQTANAGGLIKRSKVDDDVNEFVPGKWYDAAADCDDVREAMMPFEFPDVGESLISLISLAEKYMDMDTLIPKLTQGLDVKEPQMRAYVAMQQVEKAGKYVGAVVRNNDEGMIEPIIEDMYRTNMDDPDVKKGKGNYIVKAMGFQSYQDRVERMTKLRTYLEIVINEYFSGDVKFRQILEDITKAMEFESKRYLKTKEEMAEDAQQPNPAEELAIQKEASLVAKNEADAQEKTASVVLDQEELTIDRAKTVHEMEVDRERLEMERTKEAREAEADRERLDIERAKVAQAGKQQEAPKAKKVEK